MCHDVIPRHLDQGSLRQLPAASSSLLAVFAVGNCHPAASSEPVPNLGSASRFMDSSVAEGWRVAFPRTQRPPASERLHQARPHTRPQASGTAGVIFICSSPRCSDESLPISVVMGRS